LNAFQEGGAMILERTAAYILAIVCVFQTLLPSWTIKPHCWRSIDVQIGRLRVQARNDAASACFDELAVEQKARASAARMPLLRSRPEEPKRLKICMNDGNCLTAWLDGSSHAWVIFNDERGSSVSID
jgi:hypothetical protein